MALVGRAKEPIDRRLNLCAWPAVESGMTKRRERIAKSNESVTYRMTPRYAKGWRKHLRRQKAAQRKASG